MSQPIDTARVEIVPDFSAFPNAVDRDIDASLRSLQSTAQRVTENIEQDFRNVSNGATADFDRLQQSFSADAQSMERDANNIRQALANMGNDTDEARRRIEHSLEQITSEVQRQADQAEDAYSRMARGAAVDFDILQFSARDAAQRIQGYYTTSANQSQRQINTFANRSVNDFQRIERAARAATRNAIRDLNELRLAMLGLGVLTGPITTLAKFSAILSAITIAASAAVAALPPLIGFIIQLGEASVGVAALLPAALATGITLLGTFKIAVNDVGKAISTGLSGEMKQFEKAIKNLPAPTQEFVKAVVSLKPAIEQVKLSIGTRFFADLADDAKTLGNLYLPLVAHQMSQVAGAFNEGFQRAAAFLSTESTFKDFSVIFEDMPKIAAELANSLAPLLRIFTDLAVVGSGFLPTLIRGLSSAATAAADFVSRMRETGQLESFISKGLSFFGELFNLLTQIGGTFSAIFSSANAVGGGLLGTLTQIFTATNQFFSSIQGQETLATVFSSVQEVVGATLPILLTLAESIAPIVGALLPAFAQGLQALLPAAQPVGDALVAIATAVAPLIPLIGNLLAFALTFVAGILQQFATLLTPLTTLFSQLASAVLPVLTEALTQLINAGMGPLIGMVIQVIAAFAPLIPVISQIVTQFVSALMPSLLQLQSTFISAVIPVVLQLVQALAGGLLDTLVSILPQVPALTNAAIELVKAFTSLLSAVLPLLPPLVKMISNFISSQAGSESLTIAIGILTTTIRVVANTINIAVTVLNFLINSFVNTRNAAFAMASALSGAVSSALNTVRNLGNQVIGALSGAGSWLYGAGQAIVSGLVNGIKSAAGRAASAARDVVQNALSAARRALGIGSPSKEFAKLGKFSVQGFERGVSDDRDMQRTVDAVFRSTYAMEGKPGNQNTSNTQSVVFAPGSINIGFNGVVPSQQEAQQVGAAVADGITNQLAKNQVRTLTRMM